MSGFKDLFAKFLGFFKLPLGFKIYVFFKLL
jgi:hypothetical protein